MNGVSERTLTTPEDSGEEVVKRKSEYDPDESDNQWDGNSPSGKTPRPRACDSPDGPTPTHDPKAEQAQELAQKPERMLRWEQHLGPNFADHEHGVSEESDQESEPAQSAIPGLLMLMKTHQAVQHQEEGEDRPPGVVIPRDSKDAAISLIQCCEVENLSDEGRQAPESERHCSQARSVSYSPSGLHLLGTLARAVEGPPLASDVGHLNGDRTAGVRGANLRVPVVTTLPNRVDDLADVVSRPKHVSQTGPGGGEKAGVEDSFS